MTVFGVFNPIYSLAGFFVGTLVGLTGVGGGSLMTPLLVLLFGVHPATAIGTDLLYAALTKSVGTLVHGFSGTVDWRIVRRLAAGSLPAAAMTLLMLEHLGVADGQASALLNRALGIALLLTSLTLAFRPKLVAWAQKRFGRFDLGQSAWPTALAGALLGLLVSLSSVGAGAIGVTFLVVLYPRLSTVRIVGSDIAHAVPLALLAGAGHWLLGSVDFPLLGALLVGSIPGIILGSRLSALVPDLALRPVLAVVLALVGGRLVV
ncbi:MAG TPA: sulfite exporter TauE/SafE family protein [Rhodospirillaceae bacterium]|nr:sulfite exporter TauE/SafE family protein [Rhodospirillaceae bacterium]